MTLDVQNMSFADTPFGGGQPRLLTYATIDTATVVETASYFDLAADRLRVNDLIYTALDTDGTPAWKQYVVTAISAANVVTIADIIPTPAA